MEVRDVHAFAGVVFFALVHFACIGVFFVPFELSHIVLALTLYYVRMFGVTAGYHRYFSHRSYKTSRLGQFVLALLALSSAQRGVLWWASHHREHHRHSDTPNDVHSPAERGFWWAHLGWVLVHRRSEFRLKNVKDLAQYRELWWLERWHFVPPLLLALALYLLGGLSALVWGFCVSTTLLWHGTFTINSLAHVYGRQRYLTGDSSRNNWFLSILTLGEGWHNNHHYYQTSARQGFYWWEFDPTLYLLKLLSWFRIVWDIRTVPRPIRDSNRS